MRWLSPDDALADAVDLTDLSGDTLRLVRGYLARQVLQTRADVNVLVGILQETRPLLGTTVEGREFTMEDARGHVKELVRARLDAGVDLYNDPNLMGLHGMTARSIFDSLPDGGGSTMGQ